MVRGVYLGKRAEVEVAGFVEAYAHLTDSAGRRRIVRHGHLPEREIQTGIGPVAVRCPRVRDRGAGETGPRVRFTSRILPPYLRRANSIEELLPWLYLKGISTGDFCEALAALLGPEAPGLSASTIARLKEVWQGELEHWQRRDLSAKRYVYSRISQVASIFSAARRRFCYKNHEVVAYMERRIWHTRWVNRNRGAFGSFLTVD